MTFTTGVTLVPVLAKKDEEEHLVCHCCMKDLWVDDMEFIIDWDPSREDAWQEVARRMEGAFQKPVVMLVCKGCSQDPDWDEILARVAKEVEIGTWMKDDELFKVHQMN